MVSLITLLIIIFSSSITNGHNGAALEGIYEFKMDFNTRLTGEIKRDMRVYMCSKDGKIYVSIADSKPLHGFDEFTVGLAVFDDISSSRIESPNVIESNGIIIGGSHLFVDAHYKLKFEELNTILIYKYKNVKELIQKQYTLHRIKDEIKQNEKSSKCWIPYKKNGNIQNVLKNGKSIWKSNELEGLNVYDMDILNETGSNRGCWGWVNQYGIGTAAQNNIGTAGGTNFHYRYKFNGDLLVLRWDDHGTSMSSQQKQQCHWGTSIFMMIEHNMASVTFTCSDQVTGSQMIMYRESLYQSLTCPLLHNVDRNKQEL